ncbi:MAG: dihydroorotate dehydrogenase electron transfer subunit [Duncaniella sp.]|nr:dihydroorotate dehydrogenase electron transfer subunit [Duncaniella sp.]
MKEVKDFTVTAAERINELYTLLRVKPTDGSMLPRIEPGQFVQVAVNAPDVFLRRPISVNDVDVADNSLDLLVRLAGKGTRVLTGLETGARLNIMLPLGHGFSLSAPSSAGRILLIGGGVGVAPLLYLGRRLRESGIQPEFLLGARSESDLLRIYDFRAIGRVHLSTEDGSAGEKGLVTQHSVLAEPIARIYCCGPSPMMKAVAKIAAERDIDCEISLENMMACGLGACLCCVENTVKGNVCVCTEGPVFNINMLNW